MSNTPSDNDEEDILPIPSHQWESLRYIVYAESNSSFPPHIEEAIKDRGFMLFLMTLGTYNESAGAEMGIHSDNDGDKDTKVAELLNSDYQRMPGATALGARIEIALDAIESNADNWRSYMPLEVLNSGRRVSPTNTRVTFKDLFVEQGNKIQIKYEAGEFMFRVIKYDKYDNYLDEAYGESIAQALNEAFSREIKEYNAQTAREFEKEDNLQS